MQQRTPVNIESPDDAVPIGNVYDKYESSNPIARYLLEGFLSDLDEVWDLCGPGSQLDVGCGEGVLTERWAEMLDARRIVGMDLEDPELRKEWATRKRGNLSFVCGDAADLPFEDGQFDLVSAVEVLEHVKDPEAVVEELTRVASHHVLVSVPNEPLWRMLNMIRGSYWSALGNTPGHIQHWSRRSFVRLLEPHGEVVSVRTPLPWTMVLLRLPD